MISVQKIYVGKVMKTIVTTSVNSRVTKSNKITEQKTNATI